MRAYTDRILVEIINHTEKKEEDPLTANVKDKLTKALVVSAGDYPDGRSNEHLEGCHVLLSTDKGIPIRDKSNNRTLVLMRRTNIEIILNKEVIL